MKTPQQGRIFVFSAASGGGKTTILNFIRSVFPSVVYSISATTRHPRNGEKDGVHYFFFSREEFQRKIAADEFAEWAIVHDNYYGTPKVFIDQVITAGKHIVMDIDVIGKTKFDCIYPQAIGILLLPPSLDILEQRLRNRKTDDEQTILVRLANAEKEMAYAKSYGKYEFVVVNDDLETAKNEVRSIISRFILPD
jgi:guanylate kinase